MGISSRLKITQLTTHHTHSQAARAPDPSSEAPRPGLRSGPHITWSLPAATFSCASGAGRSVAGDRDGCPTHLARVVQDQGLEIPSERPESRPVKPSPSPPGRDSSVIAVLNMGRRAEPRGTWHHRVSANPNGESRFTTVHTLCTEKKKILLHGLTSLAIRLDATCGSAAGCISVSTQMAERNLSGSQHGA